MKQKEKFEKTIEKILQNLKKIDPLNILLKF